MKNLEHGTLTGVALMAAIWSIAPSALAQDEEVPPPEEPAVEILGCDEALSCPSPLFCDEDAEGGPYCSYEPITCAATADCPERFECIAGELLYTCESCEETPDGEICELVPCEDVGPDQCEPERIACEADGDCPSGWRCVELYFQWLPAHWDPPAEGELGCLSEGTIALGEGRVYLPFVTLEAGSAASGEIMESTVDPNLEDSSGPAEMGAGPKTTSSGGGCSVGALGSGGAGLGWLASVLALGLLRRRS
jgi:hypothetical protein